MQRPQVFLHFFLPSALPHHVADFAFAVHQYVPKLTGISSSHAGGGGHRVAASHSFLHLFFSFLHALSPDPNFLQCTKAALQSSLHLANSGALWHGGGDGGVGDAEGGGGVGDAEGGGGVGDDEGGGGAGDDEGGGGAGDDEGDAGGGEGTVGGEGEGGGGLGGGTGGGEGTV